MKESVLILDFSGVCAEEGLPEALGQRGIAVQRLDFNALDGCACYCDAEAEAALRTALSDRKERVHWIDSGDYHYMTKLFAQRCPQPFTLVLLDHHPDDQAPGFGPILSCGGWVGDLRRDCPEADVIAVGPEGALQTVEAFRDAFRKAAPKRVYISLDKDVMGPEAARTDWSQGSMGLGEVKEILLEVLRSGAEVLGIDICGELSAAKGGREADFELNLKTNLEIIDLCLNNLTESPCS